jgi:hypothetical protein
MRSAPTPIGRGFRFGQGVVTFVLLCGFVAAWKPVAAIVALALASGWAFGPRYDPLLRLYTDVVEPRLPPTEEQEDPRPSHFAAAASTVLLAAATIAFAAGLSGVGWAFTLIVAVHAGLTAITGICPACELYLRRASS